MATEGKRPNHRPPKERAIQPEALEKKEFFTVYEVADLLGFHWQTVLKMIRRGELPAKKYGRQWRIRKAELQEFTTPQKQKKESDEA